MGLLGSAMGRALAGAGNAAADIGNKYLDKEIQIAKAQAMADIQRESNIKQEGQLDALRNAPERIARDRANKVGDIEATGAASNKVALDGERAKATDQTLVNARIDNENRFVRDTSQTKIDAATAAGRAQMTLDIERATKMLPLEVKRAYALADAQGRASAAHRQAPGAELSAKLAIIEKTLGRPLDEAEKLGVLGLAKAPLAEVATITEKEYDANGNETRRVERKGPAGKSGQTPAADPIKAAMDAARGDGQPKPTKPSLLDRATGAPVERPATRKDPLTGQELSRAEWDRKFGRGDFDKTYGKGEPSLKAF